MLTQTSLYGHCCRQEVDGPTGWVKTLVLQSNKSLPMAMGCFWTRAQPRAKPTVNSSQPELQGCISACLARDSVKSHRWDEEVEVASQDGKGSIAKGSAPAGINLSQAAFKNQVARVLTRRQMKSVETSLPCRAMGRMQIDLTPPQPQNL